MSKLPKRLPYEAALIAALMLGSCVGPGLSDRQRDEVDDIAEAAAGESDAVRALAARVEAIEERLNM